MLTHAHSEIVQASPGCSSRIRHRNALTERVWKDAVQGLGNSGPRYGSIQYMFSRGKMCKFNRTLYNTQLIQFARIPAEFVVRFIRYQYRVKVITFSIAAQYLLLISPYSLRVQCLELYTACILSQYQWDKAFHFPGKFIGASENREMKDSFSQTSFFSLPSDS